MIALILSNGLSEGRVESLHHSLAAAQRATPLDRDGARHENVRYWRVPESTEVGEAVCLCGCDHHWTAPDGTSHHAFCEGPESCTCI